MESTTNVMYQAAVTKYAAAGVLAVLIWDILDNMPADYRMLFKDRKKLTLPNCVYISSRIGALGYQLCGVIFTTAPTKHCALLSNIAFAWCPLSFGAGGLLFFLRLRAIYNDNRFVVAAFFVLWVGAVLVSGILVPLGIKGGTLGDTAYCTYTAVYKLSFFSRLAPLCFDTLVFLAISWRLSSIGISEKKGLGASKSAVNNIVFGADLPSFTRGCLIDGQKYYLLTIFPGVVSAALQFNSPHLPIPISDLFTDGYFVLVNIMACRVFRRTRQGFVRESEISTTMLRQQALEPIQFEQVRSTDTVVSKEASMA